MIPRLSSIEYLVLAALDRLARPCYALELVESSRVSRQSGTRVEFVYPLKKGSVYVTLDRMVSKGLVDKARDYISSPRYTMTDEGKKRLALAKQFDKLK